MSFINSLDLAAAEFAAAIAKNCRFLTTPLKIITLSGTAGAVFIVAAAMLIIFQRTRTTGIKAGGALLIGFIFTNLLLKNIIARPRPYADVTSRFYEIWQSAGALKESGFSFPSGHTTAATAFGVSLFISLNKNTRGLFCSFRSSWGSREYTSAFITLPTFWAESSSERRRQYSRNQYMVL